MQQNPIDYIRSGQTPFFRLPLVDPKKRGAKAYKGAHAVVFGVPYDGGTTYQPGARLAPYHVRRVSALLSAVHPVTGANVLGKLRVYDGGNITTPPFHPAATRELVEVEAAAVHEAGAVPIVCGGDHSITLPLLRAASKAHGRLAVVHVDAHFDTSSADLWMEEHHHGTPIRHALEEGLIEPGQLHQIALRATWKDEDEPKVSENNDARLYPMHAIDAKGIRAVARRIKDAVDDRPVYVTFDVDAVDPAFAPGTGTPVPGGMTSREAIGLLRALHGITLVGMDVVEVLPALDHADITCHLAAQLLFEGLALVE